MIQDKILINALFIAPQNEILRLFEPVFREHGFNLLTVGSEQAALGVLHTKLISLVVIDGTCNHQKALETCKTIQQTQHILHREVLFIQPENNSEDIEYLIDAGVSDFITAPIDTKLLSMRLRLISNQILEHRRCSKVLDQVANRVSHASSNFFVEFVERIAKTLDVNYAIVSQRTSKLAWRAKSLSFWSVDKWGENFEYDLAGSPCEAVFRDGPQWYGEDIQERFPNDRALKKYDIKFYLGVPLQNNNGEVIGHACVLHNQPVAYEPLLVSIMNAFAAQASAEMECLAARDDAHSINAQLKTITSNLHVGLVLEDETRQVRIINQSFCDFLRNNQSPDDLLATGAEKLVDEFSPVVVDRERYLIRTDELVQLRKPVIGEEWILKDQRILQRDFFPMFENEAYKGCLWLLRDVTHQKTAEIQLNNAQEQEIEIGSKIQKTLLLGITPTDIPALNVAALSIPSKRIDGDFYDFFHVDETRLDVLVGDVMGKGVPAALLGAAVKSHFQRAMRKLLAARTGGWPEPREIVALVHRAMTEQLIELESFFTLFYMRFDVKQGECVFLDCGHMPTIWFQAKTQTSRLIQGENLPLGVSELEQFEQRAFSFEPGDFFVMYSDGLTEAPSPGGEQFGIERLKLFIDENHKLAPRPLIDQIYKHLESYTQSQHFADDLTCVIVKINENSVAEPSRRRQVRFEASLSELERARKFLQQFCDESQSKLNPDFIQKLTLSMNEAAANIIEHAYGEQEHGQWELIVEEFQDRWVLSLLHDGVPFDPNEAQEPAFDGSRSSGFGVYIIRNCVDEVVYGRHDDGRCLIQLMKRIQPVKGNQE